jgi:uroporphyrinogen-III synthase
MAARDMRTATQSQLSIFHQVSSILASDLSMDEMLGEVIGLAVRVTACDACMVYLIDHDSNEIVLRASQVPHAAALGMLRLKLGEGITGWVAEHRSVVALPEKAASDTRFKRLAALVEDTYEAFLSVPIVSGGELIGVVNVRHRTRHDHTREEIGAMIFIGEQLGVAISKSLLEEENARLLEETQEMKRELETRKLMERAKGILQQRHGLTEEDAYLRLRNQSRRLRRPIRELAEAIILTEELSRQGKISSPTH